MSTTLLDLEKGVLNLLNEPYNSTVGDLASGTGSAATIATITTSGSTASTVKTELNNAIADLARSCFPVFDTGTLSWASGTRTYSLSNFAGATGNVFWAVEGVKYSTTALRYSDRHAIQRNDPDWMTTATGTPAYWYNDGNMSIGIYPKPTSTGTVTIDGLVVPAPLAATTDTLSWLPDDMGNMLIMYAAYKIAAKNLEDPSLAPRVAFWMQQYDQGCMDLWGKLPDAVRKAHYPKSPAPIATK